MKRRQHGHCVARKVTRTYKSWNAMRERCSNSSASNYADYGGRGIVVCDRWSTFENFLADMGERPEGMTLDRKDTSGNYEPSNCRWATPTEQQRNRAFTSKLTYRGETKALVAWCEEFGISPALLRQRIGKGWSLRKCFETPIRAYTKK
jgi:hypothetical protein